MYASAFSLRLLENTKDKLETIAEKNCRSLNKQIEFAINLFIEDYEKINGKIETNKKK